MLINTSCVLWDKKGFALSLRALDFVIGDQRASNTHAKTDDARQRKRERDKTGYAKMTEEGKNEKKNIKSDAMHIILEKQNLHSLEGLEVTPLTKYNRIICITD